MLERAVTYMTLLNQPNFYAYLCAGRENDKSLISDSTKIFQLLFSTELYSYKSLFKISFCDKTH